MPEKNRKQSSIEFFFISLTYFLLHTMPVQAQTQSNMEVLYRLADSAVVRLLDRLPEESKSVFLKTSLNNLYSVFENRVISAIRESNKNVLTAPDSISSAVYFTIDDARVNYPEIFRENLFGSNFVKREISLNGSFIITNKGLVKDTHNFRFINEDTVGQGDIKNLENPAFPFTKGELPPEPLFSSLLEPAIALGTAATVIYLFFTIRSK